MIRLNNKGITIIALIITIIVLLIIASISINASLQGVEQTQENQLISELKMVQHAVLERYTKYSLTKDESLLVGEKLDTLPEIPGNDQSWQMEPQSDNPESRYYKLAPSDLNKLGIDKVEDTYVVNYKTGEVFNETIKKTDGGKALYVYAVDDN